MTHAKHDDETNDERNARLQAEYDTYVELCKQDGVAAINYVNWSASKKFHEKIAKGERAVERRHEKTEVKEERRAD